MSAYPKGRSAKSYRAQRRTRSFHRNQHTTNEGDPIGLSAGARKLASASPEENPINSFHKFRIIQFATLFTMLSDLLCCKNCKSALKFEKSYQHTGFGWKLTISC